MRRLLLPSLLIGALLTGCSTFESGEEQGPPLPPDMARQANGKTATAWPVALGDTEVRKRGYNIPPLVNAYMGLSPTMRVFGTAINHEFGQVEETGIFIAVDEILEQKRMRHIDTFAKENPDSLNLFEQLFKKKNSLIFSDFERIKPIATYQKNKKKNILFDLISLKMNEQFEVLIQQNWFDCKHVNSYKADCLMYAFFKKQPKIIDAIIKHKFYDIEISSKCFYEKFNDHFSK